MASTTNASNQIIADLQKEQNNISKYMAMPQGLQEDAKDVSETKLITGVNLRAIEQEIISNITKMGPENYKSRFHNLFSKTSELLNQLTRMPFGKSSSEFHNHPLLENYLYLKECAYYGDFGLWLLIEKFLAATNNKNDIVANHAIQAIEIKLKTLSDEIHHKNGCGMFRLDLEIIRNVYLSNNQKLIHLFARFLPVPRRKIFSQETLPKFVLEYENKAVQEIMKVMARSHWDFDFVDQQICLLQRQFRFKRRMNEERNRVSEWLKELINKDKKVTAEEMILDANIPYLPKRCNRKLAIRLYKAAKKVKLFSTVRHLTSPSALVSIFDDAIYGRRTLQEFYMPFRAAGLDGTDIQNGDGNVICFGPNEIHSNCLPAGRNTVEIIMDLDKIKCNPCLFFKQLDLGFPLTKARKFVLGEKEFYFTHTDERRLYYTNYQHPHFVMYDVATNSESNKKEPYAYSDLPHASLISYNFRRMHQLLALNFFRYIDALCKVSNQGSFTKEINVHLISQIYSELEKLSDDKLVSFLEDVGRQLTDTMEFNFYGAHRVDFDSILTINTIKNEYSQSAQRYLTERPFSLNLPQFIESLQKGNLEALQEARTHLPNLFKSYRFVNYLMSKKPASSVLNELQRDQNQFILPFYIQRLSENEKRKIEDRKQKEHDRQYGLVPWKPKQ